MNEFIASGIESDIENEEMAAGRLNLRYYFRQQPVMLAVVLVLVVIAFLFVTALSHAYHAQREALGARWSSRGLVDLKAKNFPAAVTEFRSALLYSRDDYDYQLNLAEALLGLKRAGAGSSYGEASAYLINLWDREPENGLVNLELARITAQQGETTEAIRYYHDAVNAVWPADQENMRRDARFELIDLLLRVNEKAQAQAELIALSENAASDPALRERIAALFDRAQDYDHALAAYRLALRSDEHNESALAGAGHAAFELGRYPLAQHYLRSALALDPNDQASAELLKTTELVLNTDPFREDISTAQRDRLAVEAFTTAGDRLQSCAVPKTQVPGPAGLEPGLNDEWDSIKSRVTEAGLRRDPDLLNVVMDLVFRIERHTSTLCGAPTGKDLALLLIAKSHEGSN
ncbi:MAG TPA: hypothetical protein VGG04_05025 [Candidatus Sulfotelmatobacter sp.]